MEHGWPNPLEIEEHSHADMANAYVAGAAGLPFAVLRGYAGSARPRHSARIKPIRCPFTGQELTAGVGKAATSAAKALVKVGKKTGAVVGKIKSGAVSIAEVR